jgi:hypothetical protein
MQSFAELLKELATLSRDTLQELEKFRFSLTMPRRRKPLPACQALANKMAAVLEESAAAIGISARHYARLDREILAECRVYSTEDYRHNRYPFMAVLEDLWEKQAVIEIAAHMNVERVWSVDHAAIIACAIERAAEELQKRPAVAEEPPTPQQTLPRHLPYVSPLADNADVPVPPKPTLIAVMRERAERQERLGLKLVVGGVSP